MGYALFDFLSARLRTCAEGWTKRTLERPERLPVIRCLDPETRDGR